MSEGHWAAGHPATKFISSPARKFIPWQPHRAMPAAAKLIALCLLLLLFAGCGPQKRMIKEAEKEPEPEPIEQLKGAITGTKWHVPWTVRDPKNPNGKPLPVMIADAEKGALKNDDGNVRVQLREVKARLFRDGKSAAYIEADQVTANRRDRIVIGTGNVIVNSLSDPPDTVIKADKMRWDTRTNEIVAIGNAFLTRRLPDGRIATSRSNRVLFNTQLMEFVIE